jgi:L-asparaginase II
MPFDEAAARDLRSSGTPPTALHNNCSGKHAAMLAYASHLGERIDNYLDAAHPIQRRIREVLAAFAAIEPEMIGIAIDGCSAPVFAVSVAEMARSYAQLVGCELTNLDPELCEAASRVTAAMIEYPELVGGTKGRLDTDLMRVARGALISKVGAEGVQLLGIRACARYPRALGIAIKIEDGDTRRARDPVVIETLRQLGVLDEDQLANLSSYSSVTLFNHRRLEVGAVRTCFQLT